MTILGDPRYRKSTGRTETTRGGLQVRLDDDPCNDRHCQKRCSEPNPVLRLRFVRLHLFDRPADHANNLSVDLSNRLSPLTAFR